MAREAMDLCLRELKESNKSRFDSYSVRNSVLIISHITFRDCRVHIFSDNLSRNICIYVSKNAVNRIVKIELCFLQLFAVSLSDVANKVQWNPSFGIRLFMGHLHPGDTKFGPRKMFR